MEVLIMNDKKKDEIFEHLTPSQHAEIRNQVRGLLEQAPAFQKLDNEEKQSMALNMVKVASILAKPMDNGKVSLPPQVKSLLGNKKSVSEAQFFKGTETPAGADFKAGATKAGAESMKEYVDAVDFPAFVSSLIEGVFTSIVNSTIRQMHEYSKFLEAVVKSVDDFSRDNVTDNEARDHLVDRFPSFLDLDLKEDQPRVKLRDGVDEDALPDFQQEFGLDLPIDFEEPESEQKLVKNARLELGRMRQQQLATMVLLGINRIVVTDGFINAKVVFDIKSEESLRKETAEDYDYARDYSKATSEYQRKKSFWGTSRSGSSTVTKLSTSTKYGKEAESESESRLNAKAKLTGEVQVKFKSDYFPLEKIASAGDMIKVQQTSNPNQQQE